MGLQGQGRWSELLELNTKGAAEHVFVFFFVVVF